MGIEYRSYNLGDEIFDMHSDPREQLKDNLNALNIDIKKSSEKIIKGINLLRLGNNPIKLTEKDIINIIVNEKVV